MGFKAVLYGLYRAGTWGLTGGLCMILHESMSWDTSSSKFLHREPTYVEPLAQAM